MQKNDKNIIKNTDFSFYLENVISTIYPNQAKLIKPQIITPFNNKQVILYNKQVEYARYETIIEFLYQNKNKDNEIIPHKTNVIIEIPKNNITEHEKRKTPITEQEINNILEQIKNEQTPICLNNGQIIEITDTKEQIKNKLSYTGNLIQRAPTTEELKNLNAIYKFILLSANENKNKEDITIKTTVLNYKKYREYANTTKTETLIKTIINNLDFLQQIKIRLVKYENELYPNRETATESFNILNSFSISNDKDIIIKLNKDFYNTLLSYREISKHEYINNNANINNLASYIMNIKNILKDKIKEQGYLKIHLLAIYGYLKGFDCKEITDYTTFKNKNLKLESFIDDKTKKTKTKYKRLYDTFLNYYDLELTANETQNETTARKKRLEDKELLNNIIDELNKNNDDFKITKGFITYDYINGKKENIKEHKAQNRFINDDEIKAKIKKIKPNLTQKEINKQDRFKDFITDSFIIVKFKN